MKATKYINGRYYFNNGKWVIRDNGKVLQQGQGIMAYSKALEEIAQTTTKPINDRIIWE